MDMVPYTPMQPQTSQPLAPGTSQAVHITMDESDLDWMLAKFERWFSGRSEIIQRELWISKANQAARRARSLRCRLGFLS